MIRGICRQRLGVTGQSPPIILQPHFEAKISNRTEVLREASGGIWGISQRTALELLRACPRPGQKNFSGTTAATLSWSTAWETRTSLGEMGMERRTSCCRLMTWVKMASLEIWKNCRFCKFPEEDNLQNTEKDKKMNWNWLLEKSMLASKCINNICTIKLFPYVFCKNYKDSKIQLHEKLSIST